MNVNIPYCVHEETEAGGEVPAPAQGHAAASPGTPVRLDSVLLFPGLCCSLPAAPTLPDREE